MTVNYRPADVNGRLYRKRFDNYSSGSRSGDSERKARAIVGIKIAMHRGEILYFRLPKVLHYNQCVSARIGIFEGFGHSGLNDGLVAGTIDRTIVHAGTPIKI